MHAGSSMRHSVTCGEDEGVKEGGGNSPASLTAQLGGKGDCVERVEYGME